MADSTSNPTGSHQKPAPNSPAWLNIACASVPRAREFYTSVFGWTFFSPPGSSPDAFHPFKITDSAMMGALSKSTNEQKGSNEGEECLKGGKEGITIYILVEDVEGTLAKVVGSGGKIKQEKRVEGGHTELGSFWDTEGNVVGVLRWLF